MLQSPRNAAPSNARENGRQAIAEGIQNHLDRLGDNKTRAIYSGPQPSMQPASAGSIARAHVTNAVRPNTTLFTPEQSREASSMARKNNPLGVLGDKVEGFLDLKGTAKQAAQMFDPRTPAGLVNAASMFVGGGDMGDENIPENFDMRSLTPYSPKRGMEEAVAEHRGYDYRDNLRSIDALRQRQSDPQGTDKLPHMQADMQNRLLKRQQNVHDNLFGGEVHMAPGMSIPMRPGDTPVSQPPSSTDEVIQNLAQKNVGNYTNIRAKAQERADTLGRMGKAAGGNYIPYSIRQANKSENRMDTQPTSFQRGLGASGGRVDIKQMLWDMIFGGKNAPRPPRPGEGNPYGSPYGGGPFG